MADVASAVIARAGAAIGLSPPGRKSATSARTRRKSSRPRAGSSASQESAGRQLDIMRSLVERVDALTHRFSQLGVSGKADSASTHTSSTVADGASAATKEQAEVTEAPAQRRPGTVPILEKEVCAGLFAPLKAVPDRRDLANVLLQRPAVRIPIHTYTYQLLEDQVGKEPLEGLFDLVEDVGYISPRLTSRIEAALFSKVATDGTEAMQQAVLDTFLSAIIETATEHMSLDARIDRNAHEGSMTKGTCRPDYLLAISDLLVFKGEEKRKGVVTTIAKELTDKMIPGSVGKNGKLDYLIGYATAGSRILFECIYGDRMMSMCSDTLNLAQTKDRIKLLLILINVVRVAGALYNDRHDRKVEFAATA
ncbi:hypothetical protein IWQ57_002444 [Coemansia nantahalensis]|uniref:Uncharacterized protein n=1 Tax=Coemansia nantahalensis TaxID=2789366 RepID=A0ACC1K0R2_9FUNG|nr:hypothetical protein IWQ57_002444 [Coemansia nantahalensis]